LIAYTDPDRHPANAPLAMTNDNLLPFSFPATRARKSPPLLTADA
jgi:hypothetical protein